MSTETVINKDPSLVQRLTARNKNPFVPLGERYFWDYMGNSYFEHGDAARAIEAMNSHCELGETTIDGIKVYFAFNTEHYTLDGVIDILNRLYQDKIWMEEWSGFNRRHWDRYYPVRNEKRTGNNVYDAWLEIERGLFWTWQKINVTDLKISFRVHVQYLLYNRRQRERKLPIVRQREFDRKIHIPAEWDTSEV